MKVCENYVGMHCVDGTCPNAVYYDLLYSDYGPDPSDIGLESDTKCCNCNSYKGCEDCYFAGRDPSDELYCKDERKGDKKK